MIKAIKGRINFKKVKYKGLTRDNMQNKTRLN